MRKLLAHLGLAIPVVAGLVFGVLLAASPAQAKHPTVQSQIQHYLECLNWMITDPAKHRKLCGPGHEFFLPYNNFAPTGITGMPPVTPPAPPSTPTCPEHNYEHYTAFVQYTDFVLIGEHHGGDWNKPKDGCRPPKDCYDLMSYAPSGTASVLLVGGCHEHHGCDIAWSGGEFAPSLLLVGGCPEYEGCDTAWRGGSEIPSLLLVGRHWEGGCPSAWTGAPLEAPSLLI